jgi:hypothetical protein
MGPDPGRNHSGAGIALETALVELKLFGSTDQGTADALDITYRARRWLFE